MGIEFKGINVVVLGKDKKFSTSSELKIKQAVEKYKDLIAGAEQKHSNGLHDLIEKTNGGTKPSEAVADNIASRSSERISDKAEEFEIQVIDRAKYQTLQSLEGNSRTKS